MFFEVDVIESLVIAILVLFIGRFLNYSIKPLQRFNFPEPILGGLVVAIISTVLHTIGTTINFNLPLQDTFISLFFHPLVYRRVLNCLPKAVQRYLYF